MSFAQHVSDDPPAVAVEGELADGMPVSLGFPLRRGTAKCGGDVSLTVGRRSPALDGWFLYRPGDCTIDVTYAGGAGDFVEATFEGNLVLQPNPPDLPSTLTVTNGHVKVLRRR